MLDSDFATLGSIAADTAIDVFMFESIAVVTAIDYIHTYIMYTSIAAAVAIALLMEQSIAAAVAVDCSTSEPIAAVTFHTYIHTYIIDYIHNVHIDSNVENHRCAPPWYLRGYDLNPRTALL